MQRDFFWAFPLFAPSPYSAFSPIMARKYAASSSTGSLSAAGSKRAGQAIKKEIPFLRFPFLIHVCLRERKY